MEFWFSSTLRDEPRIEPDRVTGFSVQTRRTPAGTLGWYQADGVDPSVILREFTDGLALYMGEPLCPETFDAALPHMSSDLAALGNELSRRLRGVHSVVLLQFDTKTVAITSDALGVRPWYWSFANGVLNLASTRQAIGRLIPTEMDLTGALQSSVSGYCIGARTPLRGVQRNLPGELLILSGSGRVASEFPPVAPSDDRTALPERAEELRSRFASAVKDRLFSDRWSVGFLSGGLDSRVIATSLVEKGASPTVYSLTHGASLDVALARDFAAAAGIEFQQVSFRPDRRILWAGRLRAALQRRSASAPFDPFGYAWSGDGGSVCAGGVNVDAGLSARLGTLDESTAPETVADLGFRIPSYLFDDAQAKSILRDLATDLIAETKRLQSRFGRVDSFNFLTANDQRQHLDLHFEHWREHRISFYLPFYDSEVLAWLLGTPESMIAGHRLYSAWFDLLPAFAASTPWQTYPGHQPCPLPLPEVAEYQFGGRTAQRFDTHMNERLRQRLRAWLSAGRSGWPGQTKSITSVLAAAWAVGLTRAAFSATVMSDLIDPTGYGGLELDE